MKLDCLPLEAMLLLGSILCHDYSTLGMLVRWCLSTLARGEAESCDQVATMAKPVRVPRLAIAYGLSARSREVCGVAGVKIAAMCF